MRNFCRENGNFFPKNVIQKSWAQRKKFPSPKTRRQVSAAAGDEWLSEFISRNNVFSIRRPLRPEAKSLARATSFNATTINSCFNKLSGVIDRHAFQVNDIHNLIGENSCRLSGSSP